MNITPPLQSDDLLTWLNYWGQVHVTGIDLGLDRVIPVAEQLKVTNPTAKVITVAGTNGKGSTTTSIATILQHAGYKVGLYQSPHIYHFNERVKISGKEADDQTLIDAFVQVDQARRECGLSLSFFEATTLAAFHIFAQAECDVWVLEVGLGGRLDVVNVIDPDLAVITNIGLDHVDWLGDTIEKIAFEKAGIIRQHIPVVFAGQQTLPQAIQDKAEQEQAPLYVLNRDYFYRENDDATWTFASPASTLKLPRGHLALENLSTAVAAVLLSGLQVSDQAIQRGVATANIAGRFEVREIQAKTVIFDAGHNPHGVEFLLKQLQRFLQCNKQYTNVVAVFSMLADKDIDAVVQLLKPIVSEWKIAELDVPRAAKIEQIQNALQGTQTQQFKRVAEAFQIALEQVQSHQLILVCGSFHTLEAVWEYIDHVNE
ncbi:bifunctional tetrahydrofolate synthase/dihydrofolate synthase [Acinetobacter sp. MD2(2019)]|uniref:bifunctional tetrahydrofolate synthase/dihydrofolate synthase n=1 Tax=Acinetobacter sp. MD2(2019) TaxID=2605273 RepID=UPI002D1F0075|nr:bifunctional tetrahydrofolate synthase/dihydrofolate synthase [Acinetobacter sp. MD2(2019)]MEB3754695.1 bifunctional tetrahydrofolate synthase/dihydrofolate synthase [Acinetobacter sp. MD2(2019)]